MGNLTKLKTISELYDIKSLGAELSSYYKESLSAELPLLEPYSDKLRVSGFPFCGLKKAYEKMIGKKDTKAGFGASYYTSVGTTVHISLQRWLGQGGKMWGNWKCYNKQCNHFIEFGIKQKCPKCKTEMEYEEFEVKAFRHLSGHIDGVYEDSRGQFWVIDYKTTSVKNIVRHKREKDLFPYAKNKAQILTYCFDPKTIVLTDQGQMSIEEIVSAVFYPKALSYNHITNDLEYKQITASSLHYTEEDMYEIEYDGGTLRVTENHEVWSVTRQVYVKAKDLLEDEYILSVKP